MNLELLLPAALAAGFFGGAHCLGMCGPVVVMLEGGPRQGRADAAHTGGWPRRALNNLGRLTCYALLGAVAAAAGQLLTSWPNGGLAVLRVLAALLVVAMGLSLALNRQPLAALERGGGRLWRLIAPLSRYVLPASSAPRAFGAGLLWGMLPCGLVYSAAAMAATTGDVTGGILVMTAFWCGTLPAILFASVAANRLERWRREPRLRRATGVALALVGAVALGLPYWHAGGAAGADPADEQAAAGHIHGG